LLINTASGNTQQQKTCALSAMTAALLGREVRGFSAALAAAAYFGDATNAMYKGSH
jgi:hypothetical protein